MMDFSGHAGTGSDFDLMPKGLLVFANLTVRGVKSSGGGGQYIDCELTVDAGQPFAGRKLWEMIGHPFFEGNSEKYRQMGQVAVTRILECRGAGPQNPAGYKLDDFAQLSGSRVAIKVGIEEGSGGHDDKNRVAEWLTPNPASQSGYKGFQKLLSGDHGIASNTSTTQPVNGFGGAPATQGNGNGTGGFGNGGGAAQPAPAAATSGFQQPAQDSSGQASGFAASASSQSSTTDAAASHSSPETTPGWMAQAGVAPA